MRSSSSKRSVPKAGQPDTDAPAEQIGQLIDRFNALLEEERAPTIVLAGFSQGGAMALHVGLRRQAAVAGIFAMS